MDRVDEILSRHESGPAAPAAGAMDVDSILARHAPAPARQEQAKPSKRESFLRGALQGATLGFADEVGGALESALTPKTYVQARDESRAAFAAAEKENPWTYRAGGLAGGAATALVPGLNVIKGAKLATTVAQSAALGGAAGLGSSEADLTKGDTRGAAMDVARGAVLGGVLGAAGHGLGKIVSGAPERVDRRIAGDLLDKVPARTQDKSILKLGGREGIVKFLKSEPELMEAKQAGPATLATKIDQVKDVIGDRLGKTYQGADAAMPLGVRGDKVMNVFTKLRAQAEKAGDTSLVSAIDKEQDALLALWGQRNVYKNLWHVPAEDLHSLVQRYGSKGYESGSFTNPSANAKFGRTLNEKMREVLQDYVEEVTKRNPSIGSITELRDLNSRYSKLVGLEALADAQAIRAERNAPSLGERLATLGKGAAVVGGIATGHLPMTAVGYGALKAAPVVGRTIDERVLAPLVLAARRGDSRAIAELQRLTGALGQSAVENAPPMAGVGAP